MKTAHKTDIAEAVASATGLAKSAANDAVGHTIEAIVKALQSGSKVQLPGLGVFLVKQTAARRGRNPATGEAIDVPAGKKLTFKPASDLKERL